MFGKGLRCIVAICILLSGAGCGSIVGMEKEANSAVATVKYESKSPRVESISFHSVSLDKRMPFNIYLPPGYDGKTTFPVLYLLHGYTGNEKDWVPGSGIAEKADQMIQAGKIQPLIIVSVGYDNSYGLNSAEQTRKPCSQCNDEGRYQDYLHKDIIEYVDKNYATVASREARYIGGFSMGGFSALYTAFTHPEMFSKVGGHSPAVWLDNWTNTGNLNGWLYPTEEVRKTRDPIELAQSSDLTGLSVYLDCGRDDYYQFYEGAEKLHKTLIKEGFDSQYHLNDGDHDGKYLSSQLENYLLFYSGK